MRFILTVCIWVIIVGGLWLYTAYRDAGVAGAEVVVVAENRAEGTFNVELTSTFSVEKDPFALNVDQHETPPLEVRINGREVELPAGEVSRGSVVRLEGVEGILEGQNEIFVKASPPPAESMFEHGIRIKVFRDDTMIDETTVWSSGGALVSGVLSFNYAQSGEKAHEE